VCWPARAPQVGGHPLAIREALQTGVITLESLKVPKALKAAMSYAVR